MARKKTNKTDGPVKYTGLDMVDMYDLVNNMETNLEACLDYKNAPASVAAFNKRSDFIPCNIDKIKKIMETGEFYTAGNIKTLEKSAADLVNTKTVEISGEYQKDNEGLFIDIDAVMSGEPEQFYNIGITEKKCIKIYIDLACSSGTNQIEFERRAADILAEYETALLKGYSVEIELLCAAKLMNSNTAKILKVTGLNVFDLSVFHFVLANVSFARAAVYPYKYILNGEKYFNSKIIAGIDKKELKETFDGGSIFYGALLRGKYIKEVFDGENWVTLNN